jgi:hypothetical protein
MAPVQNLTSVKTDPSRSRACETARRDRRVLRNFLRTFRVVPTFCTHRLSNHWDGTLDVRDGIAERRRLEDMVGERAALNEAWIGDCSRSIRGGDLTCAARRYAFRDRGRGRGDAFRDRGERGRRE